MFKRRSEEWKVEKKIGIIALQYLTSSGGNAKILVQYSQAKF